MLDVTEWRAFGIVDGPTAGGSWAKEKDARRDRYRVQLNGPVADDLGRRRAIDDLSKLWWATVCQKAALSGAHLGARWIDSECAAQPDHGQRSLPLVPN